MMNIQLYLKEHCNILYLLILMPIFCIGQQTVPVNLYKSTQLVFQDKLKTPKVGTENLHVKYSVDGNVLFLNAKASKGKFIPTNLYVHTVKGYHYNFTLKYQDTASKWTRLILLEDAIIKPHQVKRTRGILSEKNQYIEDLTTLNGENNLQYVLEDKRIVKRSYAKFDDVYLRYVNHYYKNQFVYYKLQIDNNSKQDYIIDFLKFFIQTKGKGKGKSNTKKLLKLDADYTWLYGKRSIGSQEKIIIVLKFRKMSLNKEQKLLIDLKEKNGSRDLQLKINSRLINKPLSFKNK